MYRIISGKWKGKRIVAPKNFEVRPTTDFAKEGLFNILENRYDFYSINVLDLFAGIGSISFEFCSRGVPKVVAVDNNYKHIQFISAQSTDLGFEHQLQLVQANVYEYVSQTKQSYDIVFADAPFDTSLEKYENLVTQILNQDMLKENGVLILEHQSKLNLENWAHFQEKRKYGNVSFSFFGL